MVEFDQFNLIPCLEIKYCSSIPRQTGKLRANAHGFWLCCGSEHEFA